MPGANIQDVAFEFYSDDKYREDLVYHTGYDCFMIYNNGHYNILNTKREFTKLVTQFIRAKFPNKNWSMNSVKDVIKWVEVETPREIDSEDDNLVAFKDKIFNITTGEAEPFSKDKYSIHYVPYNYDETKIETPIFDNFLRTSLTYKTDTNKTDDELVNVVKEMLGMLFIPNVKAGKAFFLYGKQGDNGKGVLSQVIRMMMGADLCSALSLEDLSKDFTKHKLIGKKVNVSDELDEKFGKSRIFKAIVTGDPIFTRRLYGDGFDFVPKTKLVFSTNRMPTFEGIDGGLKRRMMIIPFYKSFTNDQNKDYNLIDKLKKEIPGIVGLALNQAHKLMENNYQFSNSKAMDESMNEFLSEISSALMFFDEGYLVDDDGAYPSQELYVKYREWCDQNGKKPMSRPNFSKDLISGVNGLEVKVKRVDGKSTRTFNVMSFEPKTDDDTYLIDGKEVEF